MTLSNDVAVSVLQLHSFRDAGDPMQRQPQSAASTGSVANELCQKLPSGHVQNAIGINRAVLFLPVPDYIYPRHLLHQNLIFITSNSTTSTNMTRSHKFTDRDHSGLVDGTAEAEQHLPRYFAKQGHADQDPTKTKKNGGGKGNWGREGDEVEDFAYNMNNPRRRSNSSTYTAKDFKTKFETIEAEPVFEEELHGPMGAELDKQSTTSSSKSVEEEEANKKL